VQGRIKENQGEVVKIELSAKEYRDLLDILHIAEVVISGHRREEDMRTERHRALMQKFYALAQGEGLDQLITYNKSVNKYVPTNAFEQSALAHDLIREFGDHLFWDELISRLSVRDAAQIAGGIERLNAMSDRDRQALEGSVRQRYIEELSANGVENLALIEQFSSGAKMPVETSD
jgi:hypothetical protein